MLFLAGPTLLSAIPAAHAAGIRPSEWVIGPSRREVLITLDGRTSPRHLLGLGRTLTRHNAVASFFIPGSWVASHRSDVTRLQRVGMAFGNRGYGKRAFTNMSGPRIRSSISRAQRVLKAAGVSARPFFRLPQGARDLRVLRALARKGYRSVRWTVRPGAGSPSEVTRKVLRRVHDGAIISLDIWRSSNRRALSSIIDGLRRKGYGFRELGVLNHVHPVDWNLTLRPGSTSRAARFMARALRRSTYPAGHRRYFGYKDQEAVIAYEKVHRMRRDAIVTPGEMEGIVSDRRPRAPRSRHGRYVDVDISRQVLFEVKHRKVRHTLPVSTGGEYTYISGGHTAVAHTPRGHFSIIRKVAGWNSGSLGSLWYPNYFVGGYAIHGYPDVPVVPASHGCVRIPMYAAKPFFHREPLGVPVIVHN
ncbi:MAG: N-acetylmuramoyl-L-alanine amidase [Actinomycetota bacterium]|nr:N-acetylmuramoyl-L-alanine amidase [Actinomycetota bacterium]